MARVYLVYSCGWRGNCLFIRALAKPFILAWVGYTIVLQRRLGFSLKDVVLAEVMLQVIPCISARRMPSLPVVLRDSQSASACTTKGSVSCHRSIYLVPSAKHESEVDAGRRRTQYNNNGTMWSILSRKPPIYKNYEHLCIFMCYPNFIHLGVNSPLPYIPASPISSVLRNVPHITSEHVTVIIVNPSESVFKLLGPQLCILRHDFNFQRVPRGSHNGKPENFKLEDLVVTTR